jgi:hypothetical protein
LILSFGSYLFYSEMFKKTWLLTLTFIFNNDIYLLL